MTTNNRFDGQSRPIRKVSDADVLRHAINYAVDYPGDGIVWLRDWNEGEPEAMQELDDYMLRLTGPSQSTSQAG